MPHGMQIADRFGARRGIDPSVSVALDLTRFCLAMAVAISHWTQANFHDGFTDRTDIAVAAVGGFFVISGFTIRMVTPVAGFQPGRYAIERLSRLWSVALPALVITCFLDILSHSVNPGYYNLYWGHYRFAGLHLAASAIFLTQNWGMDISPLSNSPFWSLAYEAWFYLIFGLFMARRTLLVVVAAVLAGPNILFMMTIWLMGAVSFDVFDRVRERRHLIAMAAAATLVALLLLSISLSHAHAVQAVYEHIERWVFGTFHIMPRRSKEDLFISGLIGVPTLMALLCIARLIGGRVIVPPFVVRIGRAAGNFTFPLYLLHFPLLVFCGAMGFYDRTSPAQFFLVLFGICSVVALVTPATTMFKTIIKRRLTRGLALLEQIRIDRVARPSAETLSNDSPGRSDLVNPAQSFLSTALPD